MTRHLRWRAWLFEAHLASRLDPLKGSGLARGSASRTNVLLVRPLTSEEKHDFSGQEYLSSASLRHNSCAKSGVADEIADACCLDLHRS
jgi:hypothetical protein